MFVLTSMPVGGAETLLVELIRRLDRGAVPAGIVLPEGTRTAGRGTGGRNIPAHAGLLAHKYDVAVLRRLARLMARRRIDAVVTVGTAATRCSGAGWPPGWAGVPVVCSALHSTGLPDHVEWPNRLLAPLTDAFIAVAEPHGRYLAEHEGCPAAKVRVIPNGVDVEKFHPRWPNAGPAAELGLPPGTPTAGIVAALRPEKNHELFLRAAAMVHAAIARGPLPGRWRWPAAGGPGDAGRGVVAGRGGPASRHAQRRARGARRWWTCWCSPRTWRPIRSRSWRRWRPRSRWSARGSAPWRKRSWTGKTGYLVAPGAAEELAARMIELLRRSPAGRRHGPRRPRTGRGPLVDRAARWRATRICWRASIPPRWGPGDLGLAIAGSPGHECRGLQVPGPAVPSLSRRCPQPPAPSPQPPVRLRWETGSRFRVAPSRKRSRPRR